VPEEVRARLSALREAQKSLRDRPESGLWREAFAEPGSPFEALREFDVAFEHANDREGLLALFASQSWVAALPDGEREALLAEGEYRRQFRASVAWTRLGG